MHFDRHGVSGGVGCTPLLHAGIGLSISNDVGLVFCGTEVDGRILRVRQEAGRGMPERMGRGGGGSRESDMKRQDQGRLLRYGAGAKAFQ
jgi:hypothetical protein